MMIVTDPIMHGSKYHFGFVDNQYMLFWAT
jgi:hypothetical protein